MTTTQLPRTASPPSLRLASAVVWGAWPAGLVLIVAHTVGGLLDLWAFAVLAGGYVIALGLALQALGRSSAAGTARLLVLVGPLVFVLAGLTGPPTAAEPGRMLLNAAVLALAAGVLLVAATGLVLDGERRDRAALLGLLAIVIGSCGWAINLVSRWAVVLSGASGLQADVEATAWMADVYLRGLPTEPTFLAYLLVLMDLLQLVYLVLCYLGFALISRSAVRRGAVASRAGRPIAAVAAFLAGTTLIAAGAAAWAGPVSAAAAGIAFALTIPFMSTLVPALLGGAMLTTPPARR